MAPADLVVDQGQEAGDDPGIHTCPRLPGVGARLTRGPAGLLSLDLARRAAERGDQVGEVLAGGSRDVVRVVGRAPLAGDLGVGLGAPAGSPPELDAGRPL